MCSMNIIIIVIIFCLCLDRAIMIDCACVYECVRVCTKLVHEANSTLYTNWKKNSCAVKHYADNNHVGYTRQGS